MDGSLTLSSTMLAKHSCLADTLFTSIESVLYISLTSQAIRFISRTTEAQLFIEFASSEWRTTCTGTSWGTSSSSKMDLKDRTSSRTTWSWEINESGVYSTLMQQTTLASGLSTRITSSSEITQSDVAKGSCMP